MVVTPAPVELVELDQDQDQEVVAEMGAPRLLDVPVAFEAAVVLLVLFLQV